MRLPLIAAAILALAGPAAAAPLPSVDAQVKQKMADCWKAHPGLYCVSANDHFMDVVGACPIFGSTASSMMGMRLAGFTKDMVAEQTGYSGLLARGISVDRMQWLLDHTFAAPPRVEPRVFGGLMYKLCMASVGITAE